VEWMPALISLSFVAFALISHRVEQSFVTGPMIFAALGLLIGPEVIDLIDPSRSANTIDTLLAVTLVIVLFTDASAINSSRWREDAVLAGRLLGIGLPISIGLGWILALLILTDVEVWQAAMLGAMLAPTDAALGKAVVSNPRVPRRIRQALGVESGLNDGIVLPLFVVFFELARAAEESPTALDVVTELLAEVGIALIVGVAVGWLGARLIALATAAEWAAKCWLDIAVVSLAVLSFAIADPLNGSGFIAAWVAGLVFGRARTDANDHIEHLAESVSDAFTMMSFLVFGLLLGPALSGLTWRVILYAVLSLTLVRLTAVVIAMLGSGMNRVSLLYLGWFGPRGLATLILAVSVAEVADFVGGPFINQVALVTVALSVIGHGVTAWWGSNSYADWIAAHPDSDDMMESMPTPELRPPRRIVVRKAPTERP
jgi:sodium/hydrogen antiporter